ncbi:serine/threonine-protein kinase [Thermopolyspora sp. NPDC052614]|uniref:serine/threonine-protein kinase n=1 Tax=Thermopolyspora sp. NPDC052614 TaxID=3155682 RepID=UPI00341297F5
MSYPQGPGPHLPSPPYGGVPGRLSGARQAVSVVWALAPLYTFGLLTFAVVASAAIRLRSLFQAMAVIFYFTLMILGLIASDHDYALSEAFFAIAWLTNMIGGLVHTLLIRQSVFMPRSARAAHRHAAPHAWPPRPVAPAPQAPFPAHPAAAPLPMATPFTVPTNSGPHAPAPHAPAPHTPAPHAPGSHSPARHSWPTPPGPPSPGPRDWTPSPNQAAWGPATPPPQGPPRRLGQYLLLDKIGEGGQGTVYLAQHPDGTRVALKVLHHRVSERERETFIREVTAARRVPSYSTARIIDAGVMDGSAYIVSEYVAGSSLERQVRKEGPMSGDSLIRLAIATSGALAAIHRAGIVHRDFKPANVLLAPDGPRVIDFGLAKALDQGTTTAGIKGTPLYMSPEQINGESIGPASDIFSWGSTMIYGGTGRIAFNGSNPYQVLHQIMTKEPDLSGLPGPLVRPIAACLDKDPRNRPKASELIAAITG